MESIIKKTLLLGLQHFKNSNFYFLSLNCSSPSLLLWMMRIRGAYETIIYKNRRMILDSQKSDLWYSLFSINPLCRSSNYQILILYFQITIRWWGYWNSQITIRWWGYCEPNIRQWVSGCRGPKFAIMRLRRW